MNVHQNVARLADVISNEVSCTCTDPNTKCILGKFRKFFLFYKDNHKVHFIVVNLRKGRRSKSNTYINMR